MRSWYSTETVDYISQAIKILDAEQTQPDEGTAAEKEP